ncbi:MAG: galactokinase [Eggerthellaceae bacterium]|nr:galactokinase [Eggerthellaceae bacterium]
MPQIEAFAPGRAELAGNHTDHQGGRVIAAAVDCGIRLTLQPSDFGEARVESEGFAPFAVDLSSTEPVEGEQNTSAALVRGIVAGLRGAGVSVGGFDAKVESAIPAGGGLSSSAAFELVIAQALNVAFGDGALAPEQLARIGQAAERDWFGKPCGLMDQMAVALGGVSLLDFSGGGCMAQQIDFDFEAAGLALALVDTHCDHSAYADEYTQVAKDMDALAGYLGAAVLSKVPESVFMARLADVRANLGDLPALRGLHYYREMALVDERAHALQEGDVGTFLEATRRSGASSAMYLQNVSTADRRVQPAMVVLALADRLLAGRGAVRIHGGGFGGTVQAFVPIECFDAFAQAMDAQLGAGSCRRYRVANRGASASWVG